MSSTSTRSIFIIFSSLMMISIVISSSEASLGDEDELQDYLNILKEFSRIELQKSEYEGHTCMDFTFETENDCKWTFKMGNFIDTVSEIISSSTSENFKVKDQIMAAISVVASPCTCAPTEVTDGCNNAIVEADKGLKYLCSK